MLVRDLHIRHGSFWTIRVAEIRVLAAILIVEFSDFRDSFAALPSGSLAPGDVRTPEFCLYEDRRIVAYYAPLTT